MSNYSVSLVGPAPWGFRLQGGKDFCLPLTISRLTDGGKAALAEISVGDVVLSIDGISTASMNHLEAQNKIKACEGNLNLTLQKPPSVTKTDAVPKAEPQEIIKPVPISHPAPPTTFTSPSPQPGAAYNKTARPFGGGSGVSAPKVASIPSASSAFTPAAPSQPQPPQPPFPLSGTSRSPAPASAPAPSRAPAPVNATVPAFKPGSGRSAFTSPSSSSSASSSSSSSSSSARVTAPSSNPNVPQPSVYNTPINLYSNNNACEVVMGQRRGLLEKPGVVEQFNGLGRKPVVEAEPEPIVHAPNLSEASKLRLMEDTEDWHPRSGTAQSRSFRILAQITGTEKEQGQDNNSPKNDTAHEAPPSAHITSSAKTFTKAPAGAPRNGTGGVPPPTMKAAAAQGKPSWQAGGPAGAPKGVAAPLFGRVTNTAVPKGPDRPAPQPHPQDLDCLVQKAEHIPAGTRTPMCGGCNNVIRGPFLVAMGMSWHPEEFNCAHCHASLAECGFVEERGAVYCARCYEEFFAPSCTRCQQKILGEVINALKQTWHVYCFLCASCQQPIRNNTFHLEDGQPYCERDYYSLFGTSCHGCDFPIEAGDKFLDALGFTWHDTCFVCAVCNTSLEGQAFFSKKDKPLCKKHAHTVKM